MNIPNPGNILLHRGSGMVAEVISANKKMFAAMILSPGKAAQITPVGEVQVCLSPADWMVIGLDKPSFLADFAQHISVTPGMTLDLALGEYGGLQ